MGEGPLIDHLKRVRAFADCSDDELEAISGLMNEVSIDTGQHLTEQGDDPQDFIVIIDGHASVAKDGEEIAGVMEGSFVGELALLDNTRRNATVTAVTPLRAYVLSASDFPALLDRAPTLRGKIERAAADRRR